MVFGSRTRAKVLGYLAESSTPQTGYAISKSLEIGVSKVYGELKRLESCGILIGDLDVRGRKRFLLNDEDLRRFLVRNVRILPAEDWFAQSRIEERRRIYEEMKRVAVRLPAAATRVRNRPLASELRRSPAKDRALDRMRKSPNRWR